MRPITLAMTAVALLLNQPALSARKTVRLEGMKYPKARQVILGHGWKPFPGDCTGPDVDDRICRRYPEIDNCTGVGVGLCSMKFTKKDRCLILLTVGSAPQVGYPSDTAIQEVTFSRGRC